MIIYHSGWLNGGLDQTQETIGYSFPSLFEKNSSFVAVKGSMMKVGDGEIYFFADFRALGAGLAVFEVTRV